jgi:hypothetical protein
MPVLAGALLGFDLELPAHPSVAAACPVEKLPALVTSLAGPCRSPMVARHHPV